MNKVGGVAQPRSIIYFCSCQIWKLLEMAHHCCFSNSCLALIYVCNQLYRACFYFVLLCRVSTTTPLSHLSQWLVHFPRGWVWHIRLNHTGPDKLSQSSWLMVTMYYTQNKIINATLLFLPPFLTSWTQSSKTFSMYTKGLFLSNVVHKSKSMLVTMCCCCQPTFTSRHFKVII